MSFLLTVLKICATLQSISQTIANSHNFVDRNYIFKDNKQTKNIKANKKIQHENASFIWNYKKRLKFIVSTFPASYENVSNMFTIIAIIEIKQ